MHKLKLRGVGTVLLIGFFAFLIVILDQSGTSRDSSSRLQVAQVAASTQTGANVAVRVSKEVDCEADPQTHVFFDITPTNGATLSIIDNGTQRNFDAIGASEEDSDGYFANGTYQALVVPSTGFTLLTPRTITFTVASTCGDETPPITSEPVKATTSPTLLPPPPVPHPVKTTVPPPTVKIVTPPSNPKTESVATKPEISPALPQPNSSSTSVMEQSTTCANAEECAHVCIGTDTPMLSCEKYITEVVIATSTLESAANTQAAIDNYLVAREGARAFVDSDNDGISNFDEVNIYRTDPTISDSDHDGVLDGKEVTAHTDPLATGSATTIVFEDPRAHGATSTSALIVSQSVSTEKTTDTDGKEHLSKIKFSGRAPANSFVTLFIYSEPIVVTIKADNAGAWTYTLDKELPDGQHEVYSAIADASGRTLAKSAPLPFIKQALALSVNGTPVLPTNEAPGFFTSSSLSLMFGILIVILAAAFILIGVMTGKRAKESENTTDASSPNPPL